MGKETWEQNISMFSYFSYLYRYLNQNYNKVFIYLVFFFLKKACEVKVNQV